MAMKRVPTVKKAAPRKAKVPAVKDGGAMVVLESMQMIGPVNGRVDPELRRQLVAAEAYYLAERRGFAAGNELADWVAAERAVDSRLQEALVA